MNLKINYFLFLFLLLFFISCIHEEDTSINLNEYGVNTASNRAALSLLITQPESIKPYVINYSEYIKNQWGTNQNTSSNNQELSSEEMLKTYSECGNCSSNHKLYMMPLLKEIVAATNDEVLNILNEYEQEITNSNIENGVKSELLFILYAFKIKAENTLKIIEMNQDNSGFWDCLRGSAGRAIGEGLATGFVTGCAYGAYVGATAGSLTVPILGTAFGAVGGCVFSGAAGAVLGAVGNTALAAGKCLF